MINVLFISSGNSKEGISPIIKNQGESLKKQGVNIIYFTIKGKGLIGYLKNIKRLKRCIKNNNFDLFHAHYSMSAFTASLARAKPLVVSLMGSDLKSKRYFKIFIFLCYKFFWEKVIVKSQDMQDSLGMKNSEIIPNGVDIGQFRPMSQDISKKKLGWNENKKQVLFAANPKRKEKNFSLARQAFLLIENDNYELKVLEDVPNDLMPIFFNAADLILLTSFWEGSPNVIKEALACNRPILATNVGDVHTLFDGVNGCDIISYNAKDVAERIIYSLENTSLSNGMQKIQSLELDSKSVAMRIIKLYKEIKLKENTQLEMRSKMKKDK